MQALARFSILLGLLLGMAGASALELQIPPHRQAISEWGWAAATAMVVDYAKGSVTPDCQVLAAYDRLLGGPGTCCDDPLACLRPAVSQEIAFVLESIYGVHGRHSPRALTFPEIAAEIDGDRPVIAALRKFDTDHVIVIVGYEGGDQVVLVDPKRGRTRVAYELVRENPVLGAWRDSVTLSHLPRERTRLDRPPESAFQPERTAQPERGRRVEIAPQPVFLAKEKDSGVRTFLPPPPDVLFPVQPVCIFC